jgi:serine protease
MKTRLLILLFFVKWLNIQAQKNDHIKGQFIVQLSNSERLNDFLMAFPVFQTKQFLPQKLAPTLPIFLLSFDENSNEKALLQTIQKHPSVIAAQYNHILEDRATPNDTKYTSQWYHNNTGPSPAIADADMDTDDAWNITKGGATTDGDSIVVAVIDNGTNLSHPDLQQNLWFNRQEIPDNGIDDDRNGFVDDYRGWNSASRNDNVDGGTHGVEVEGVIGAVGNNNRGVAGVNWSVKIMTVVYDGSEASVIGCYGYVMAQRKLYNQTNGRRGAFIVATNSSFGSPNRFARDAPVWCAMYDSLGAVGVLNISATANNNDNVDQIGDLPSTCPSDYLVVVTSTDNRDMKASDAAYGSINVDVAAPGVAVWTTAANGDYTSTRGTSLACPMVSGIAALAYSAPCPDFTNFAKTNPSGAALLLKTWILQGAEPKADLTDKIKTGARVNAFNTVQKVVQYCGSCPQPSKIQVNATTTAASVSMAFQTASNTIAARYRLLGSATWLPIASSTAPLSINGLELCTNYELELKTTCVGASSPVFIVPFKTDGCCSYPENVLISNVLANEMTVKMSKVTTATAYNVCLRETPTGGCAIFKSITDTAFVLNNLKTCQNYQVAIRAICPNVSNNKDTVLSVRTKGCGACADSIYCRSSGSTTSEWIDSFSIANFKFFSGKNGGFAKFDTTITTLEAGKSYPVSLKPGFSGSPFSEGARVWIDLNQDGDFDDTGEQVVEFPRFTSTVSGSVAIPNTAKKGVTRLRVGMKYVGFSGTPSTACESFSGGEVEDYCVRIENTIPTVEILRGDDFAVYPNPFTHSLTIKNKNTDNSSIHSIELLSLDGRVLFLKKIENNFSETVLTDLPPLSNGLYFLKIRTEKGIWMTKIVH